MKKILFFLSLMLVCTLCFPQLTQDFESVIFPPSGWVRNPGSGDTWVSATTNTFGGNDNNSSPFFVNPHSGTKMAKFASFDFVAGNTAELISPAVNLTTGGPHVVKFWFHRDDGFQNSNDSIVVYINTTQSITGATRINKAIRPIGSPPQQWTQYSFNIPTSFNTSSNYIIFKAYSDFGNNMFIDDISVETAVACNAPLVSVTAVTNTTATVSWNLVSGTTGYEQAITTSALPPSSGSFTTSTSVNATGLLMNTQYYAHVRSQCPGSNFSSWSTTPFKTAAFSCSAATLITACGVSQVATLIPGTGSYNISACGFNTPGIEKLYIFHATVTGNYTLNITTADGNFIDYFYKNASLGCGPDGWICIDDNDTAGLDIFGPLTAGVTYYFLLDPEDFTVTASHTFQLDCTELNPPSCTSNIAPTNGSTGINLPPTLNWNIVPGAASYNIYFGTSNPPTTIIGNSAGTSFTNLTAVGSTTYYWYVAPVNNAGVNTGCSGTTYSFTTAPAPPNDTICGAILLLAGGVADCRNTLNASSAGDPALPGGCSSPNNTVWYTYTPTASGPATIIIDIPSGSANPLEGYIVWYSATGTCPAGLSLTPLAGFDCNEFGQNGAGNSDTLISGSLTAGTTYYIMVDGFLTSTGDFCIRIISPLAPGMAEWIGAVNTDWTNMGNWKNGILPNSTSDVLINSGLPNYPVITLNVEIKSINVKPGAQVNLATGFTLKLNGN